VAVGPVGNVILVNQMTPSVSSVQNSHDNRIEFQNMAAQAAIQEKEAEVLEVRPAEENHEVDPDRDHQRDEADREAQRSKREKESEEEEVEESVAMHKLDIMV
jgi:hypothetical protein